MGTNKPTITPLAEYAAHILAYCHNELWALADRVGWADLDERIAIEDAANRLYDLDVIGAYNVLSGTAKQFQHWPTEKLGRRLQAVEDRLESILTVEDLDAVDGMAIAIQMAVSEYRCREAARTYLAGGGAEMLS